MNHASWVDRVLSISAVIAALAAVFVSVYEAYIDRTYQRTSVWPYVVLENAWVEGQPYRFLVANQGLGPALIRSFEVRVGGKAMRHWPQVVNAVTGHTGPVNLIYGSVVRGMVLLPGHDQRVLNLPDPALARAYFAHKDAVQVSLCYCSLYHQCWREDPTHAEPYPVDRCHAVAAQQMAP